MPFAIGLCHLLSAYAAGQSELHAIASIQQALALIQENHLHLPLLIPDVEVLKGLREDSPEFYEKYLKSIDYEIETTRTERLKRFNIPAFYATCGQFLAHERLCRAP